MIRVGLFFNRLRSRTTRTYAFSPRDKSLCDFLFRHEQDTETNYWEMPSFVFPPLINLFCVDNLFCVNVAILIRATSLGQNFFGFKAHI
jgi:hypothetical protein